jgi:hypothetical protein
MHKTTHAYIYTYTHICIHTYIHTQKVTAEAVQDGFCAAAEVWRAALERDSYIHGTDCCSHLPIVPTPVAANAPVDASSSPGAGKENILESIQGTDVGKADASSSPGAGKGELQESNQEMSSSGEANTPGDDHVRGMDPKQKLLRGKKRDAQKQSLEPRMKGAGYVRGENESSLVEDDEMQRQATWEAIHESRCVRMYDASVCIYIYVCVNS